MRSLIWAAGLSLILAAGLDSSALAENTRIPLRPGLTLDAVDGKIQEYFQQILDSELDPEAKKSGWPVIHATAWKLLLITLEPEYFYG